MEQSHAALLAIERLYHGRKTDSKSSKQPDTPNWNMCSLALECGVRLKEPKGQVVVAVIGDALSGKSSFLNACAEELVFPRRPVQAPKAFELKAAVHWAQWAVSEDVEEGEWPGLLVRLIQRFPSLEPKKAVKVCRVAGSRLKGLQLIEVRAPSDVTENDLDIVKILLSQVDIVVCLLDSQAKQPASDDLLTLLSSVLASEEPPVLHFLLAKADLVARESDRIRLIAKASRLLQERLGRGFEILPAASDLNSLLDIIEDCMPKWDAGRMRTWQLSQDLICQRMKAGMRDLQLDLEALKSAVASQRRDPQATSNHLMWCGAAFVIVTGIVPFVLDEEQDASLVPIFMAATLVVACPSQRVKPISVSRSASSHCWRSRLRCGMHTKAIQVRPVRIKASKCRLSLVMDGLEQTDHKLG
ncbi:unnamed protein product [Durusdinium trenchii]|uniref:G domain-containing protein n=1 Tax=Durusdinium trenchii TaxID=1381693 RepID=A0ABP0HAC8_9DINO